MLNPHAEEMLGDHQCGFRRKGQLLIVYSSFVTYLRKKMKIQLSSASAIYKHQESA